MEKKNEKEESSKRQKLRQPSEKYEVDHEKERAAPAKKFGSSKKSK